MGEKPLRDGEARRRIRSCLDQTFLVEAGAGSGKTTCLVERMIALLAAGRCQPEQLAAVTFTRKAAGELKERFQVELEKRFRREQDEQTRERLHRALEKIERCFVGTIHSFCARLLRERPIEAGIAPDFAEIEGWDEKLLEETAWEEHLAEVGANQRHLLERLEDLDVAPVELREAFGELNQYPDVEMQRAQIARPDFSATRKELSEFVAWARGYLPAGEPKNGWDNVQELIRMAWRWQRRFDLEDDRYLLRLLARLDKDLSIKDFTQYKWGKRYEEQGYEEKEAKKMGKADAEEFLSRFQPFRENYVQPAVQSWKEYRHFYLLEFLQRGVERYRESRRQENLLTYQDLLMLTARLLRDNPGVRRYFQGRYTHLLVDEFQDTDPVQAEIAFYLTGHDDQERDWTRLQPRPGSLFVVGDPKQSIYRFRRADIATYDRVKRIVADWGEVLELTANFRSQPALIQLADRAFAELFDPISPPYQADFTPMDEQRQSAPGCVEGGLRLEIEDQKGQSTEKIAAADAGQVGEWIRRAVDGGLQLERTSGEEEGGLGSTPEYRDFLIIVRYRKYMSYYSRALEARGIPFTVSGSGDMQEADELWELLYLLQALADPDNPVPVVATLRGLFFGFSDDFLYRYREAGGRFGFFSEVPAAADAAVRQAFEEAWAQFRRYYDWTRRYAPSAAVEKIADDLGLIPHALAVEGGRGRVGSVVQALEFLRHREQRGEADLAGALDFLEQLLEEGVDEEVAIDGGSTSAVRIINLHRAKGLEAPVVFLANPGNAKSHEPQFHVSRDGDKADGYLVIKKTDQYNNVHQFAFPPRWDQQREEERLYQEAEETRLLYVAATRAKNLLVVSTYPSHPEKSPWQALEPFLGEMNAAEAFSVLRPPGAKVARGQEEGKAPPIENNSLGQARERRQSRLERLEEPQYSRRSGSDAHAGTAAPRRQTQGQGKEWGVLVHSALEELVRQGRPGVGPGPESAGDVPGRDTPFRFSRQGLEDLVRRVVYRHQASRDYLPDLTATLEQVVNSPFWQRVLAAEKVMTEVPFGYWDEDAYSTGAVDLAFREGGQWVLVDYKSDVVETEEHQDQLVEHYRPQVQFYRDCWQGVTGEAVAGCGLFFTDNLRYVTVE